MKILNRLPYYTGPMTVDVRGEGLRVRPYQIIVWVSVSLREVLDWDPRTPRLPALLDTGNNHNFSIYRSQLIRWAGIRPELLPLLSRIREQGKSVPLHAATIWLHPNQPRKGEVSQQDPYPLTLEKGIAVYPDEGVALHLPLSGLRALTDNELHTSIDGKRRQVTVRAPRQRWFAW